MDFFYRQTSLPLILKGIQTKEDALLAMEYGADAIYVSNHGGRQLDSGKATVRQIRVVSLINTQVVFFL